MLKTFSNYPGFHKRSPRDLFVLERELFTRRKIWCVLVRFCVQHQFDVKFWLDFALGFFLRIFIHNWELLFRNHEKHCSEKLWNTYVTKTPEIWYVNKEITFH